MTHHNYEIKGAYYRPPAKAILSVLPVDTPLTLRHDPYGNTCGVAHNDPNAIAIFVKSENIPKDSEDEKPLTLALANVGFTEELLRAQGEWHLGYVPKEFAAKICLTSDHDAHLSFWSNKPYVTWETSDARVLDLR